MKNNLLRLKLKQRLNKLASNDFTNMECWQDAELINKAQNGWVRRNLHGANIHKEGDEQSSFRIDDFQILLEDQDIKGAQKDLYYETVTLPENYMRFKRISAKAYTKECRDSRKITISLVEEANVDELLVDALQSPSFKWSETFCTLIGNKVRIYTNGEFFIKDVHITFYRFPREVIFEGCRDWNDDVGFDQELEFKDDVVELIIDEAVKIAAGDMNDFNNMSRIEKKVEEDN